MKESDAKPESSPELRVTLRFCRSNLAEQAVARQIREALKSAPQAFLDRVVVQEVRCADRCAICDLGPMVVIDGKPVMPATLELVVEEVTRRVAPERLRTPKE